MGRFSDPRAICCTAVAVFWLAAPAGVFRGAANPDAVAGWEAWLGRPAHTVLDFLSRESWTKISSPAWWVENWSRSERRAAPPRLRRLLVPRGESDAPPAGRGLPLRLVPEPGPRHDRAQPRLPR
jgi:hypothetical protein